MQLNRSPERLLVLACFFPVAVNLTGSSSNSQIILNFIFLAISLGMVGMRSIFPSIPMRNVVWLFPVVPLLLFSSMFFGIEVNRAFSDTARFILFIFFVSLGYGADLHRDRFSQLIVNIGVVQVIFSTLVFLPGIAQVIDFFKARMSTDDVPFHYFRFSGSLGFPTEFSLFLVLCVSIILFRLNRKPLKSLDVIKLFVLAFGVLGSVSRSGYMAMGLMAIIFFVLWSGQLLMTSRLPRYKFHFASLGAVGISVSVYLVLFSYSGSSELNISSYVSLSDGLDASILHRFSEISCGLKALSSFSSYADSICGLGVIESTFGFFVIRHSVFGFLALFFWLLFIVSCIFRCVASRSDLGFGVGLMLACYLICYAPFSEALMRSKGVFIFAFIIGTGLRSKYLFFRNAG
jgi:hypothetical protein